MSSPLHVILGAGPVGRTLAERLSSEGRRVRVATRSGQAEGVPAEEVVTADVTDPEAARRACADARVVFGCVGRGYGDWSRVWPPLMEGMLAGAESAGARFVFVDNLYMYGPVDGPLVEDLPLTDYGDKPAARARVTRLWREAHEDGRVQATAVRASDFYGPGVTMSALGERSFGGLARGQVAQCVGDPQQLHSYTYVPDLARALVTLADAEDDAYGQAWHVPNAPDLTTAEVLRRFAEEVGQPYRLSVLPRWLHGVLGLFVSDLRELKEMMYQWERPFRVDHAKFAARFWGDATPFDEGLKATADWYRHLGS